MGHLPHFLKRTVQAGLVGGEREHTILGQGNQEVYLASMLERVVQLLEQQDGRLRALESGMPRTVPNESLLPSVLSDTRLMNLRLPEFIDVTFYSGSFKLGLNAQLQLNEVIELMGRYPQLRVVLYRIRRTCKESGYRIWLSRETALLQFVRMCFRVVSMQNAYF